MESYNPGMHTGQNRRESLTRSNIFCSFEKEECEHSETTPLTEENAMGYNASKVKQYRGVCESKSQ
eukprot:m.247817 g.247817  ORF g.247817 m.247817 type:complete len:66 (-) comp16130_c0_seq16:2726-2923(-)